jgi:predicted small metal-binding protein
LGSASLRGYFRPQFQLQKSKMKTQLSLLALALTLALALAAPSRGEEKMKPEKAPASKEPTFSAACPSPCEFSIKSHDKSEVASLLKEHSKTHHHLDLPEKDVEGMIKTRAAKKEKE